jgi:hypothetical protein
VVQGALRETEHLRADPDPSLVERLDGDLVAGAHLAEHVGAGDPHTLEDQLARRRGPDAELVLLLADGEPLGVAVDEERGDALVAHLGIDGGEEDEDPRLRRVGDPHLAAVDHPVVAVGSGAALERERVRAGADLAERIRAHCVGREAGEPPGLLLLGAPAKQRIDHERVLDVREHGHGRVDPAELLDHEHRGEEVGPRAAVDLRDLDAHDPELEELLDEPRVDDLRPVHFHDLRRHLGGRELAHRLPEHVLLLGEAGERGAGVDE